MFLLMRYHNPHPQNSGFQWVTPRLPQHILDFDFLICGGILKGTFKEAGSEIT